MSVTDVFNPLANIVLLLSEEQISEIVAWFDENSKPLLLLNDQELTNVIKIEQLKQFLELKKFHRRSFHYPSYAEIMKEVEKLKAAATRMLTKDQLIYMLNKWVTFPDIKHELRLAFKVFDTEKRDFLEVDEISTIVTSYADIFNEAETRELLRDVNVRGDGNVFYDDFIESLFNLAPELYKLKVEYLYENPDEDPSVPPEPVIEEPPPVVPEPEVVEPPPEVKPEDKKAKQKKK